MTFRSGYGLNDKDPNRVETTGYADFPSAYDGLITTLQQLAAQAQGYSYVPYAISGISGMTGDFTFRGPDLVMYYVLEDNGNG